MTFLSTFINILEGNLVTLHAGGVASSILAAPTIFQQLSMEYGPPLRTGGVERDVASSAHLFGVGAEGKHSDEIGLVTPLHPRRASIRQWVHGKLGLPDKRPPRVEVDSHSPRGGAGQRSRACVGRTVATAGCGTLPKQTGETQSSDRSPALPKSGHR